MVWTYRPNITN